MTDVTQILGQIEEGNPHAAEKLLPLLYEELRKLAAQKLVHEKPGQTLQATALVHEAYVRLVDADKSQHWNSRGHFFGAAAEAMRRILVENARRRARIKHGGDRVREEFGSSGVAAPEIDEDLLALDEVLTRLAAIDPQQSRVVELRFFGGLTMEETAEVMDISPATVGREWTLAKAWLYAELSRSE